MDQIQRPIRDAGLLVLGRKTGEEIVIGEGDNAVSVKVVEIRGDKCKLSIRAPRSTSVHRGEIYDRNHPYDPARNDGTTLAPLAAVVEM